MSKHQCHAEGCEVEIPPRLLMVVEDARFLELAQSYLENHNGS